jgi:glutamate-ammonia-ligase adenylyltransferase
MSYASDVDVIFVCESGGLCTKKDRDGEAFWTRVVTNLIKSFQRIYEIDPRLRPWGEQGQMVITIDALQQYWSQPRDLWERLAMTRVAYLCGNKDIAGTAVQCILESATHQALPEDAAQQIRDMRQRMEESVSGRDHLKRGYGGYVDIEFIAQYLFLTCHSGPLSAAMDIRTCLSYLSEKGCLSHVDAEQLQEALRILRGIEARMRLSAGKTISSIPTDAYERLALARRCGYTDVETLNDRVAWSREVTRLLFESLIK